MMIPKFRVFIKDITGYNKSHFDRPEIGYLQEVTMIDFDREEITIECLSEIELDFDNVELMQFTGALDEIGKEIYDSDIVEGIHPFNRIGGVNDRDKFIVQHRYQNGFVVMPMIKDHL